MLTFKEEWKAILDIASKQTIIFSSFYGDHEFRKLSLQKIKIPYVEQKVEEFEIRYTSDNFQSSKTWMQNQYRIFLWILLHHAHNANKAPLQFDFQDWSLLSKLFNKPAIICNYFYLCSRKGRSSSWTTEEDALLREAMKLPDYQSRWTDIGMLIFVQTQRQCFRKPKTIRQRWLNHLHPDLIKDQWSLEEDLQICKLVLSEGKKWSLISKKLCHRSEHAVKNRFNSLLHRRVHRSRFESKKKQEEKMIKKYIQKIQNLLQKKDQKEVGQIEQCEEKNQLCLIAERHPTAFALSNPS